MIKVILLVTAQLAAQPSMPPSNTCRDGATMNLAPTGAILKQCADRETITLERSGERADLVATATVSKCDPSFKAVHAYVEQCQGWDIAALPTQSDALQLPIPLFSKWWR
ncbi:MAG: hypothetical protein ABI240_04505 [Sphingomonas sp.]